MHDSFNPSGSSVEIFLDIVPVDAEGVEVFALAYHHLQELYGELAAVLRDHRVPGFMKSDIWQIVILQISLPTAIECRRFHVVPSHHVRKDPGRHNASGFQESLLVIEDCLGLLSHFNSSPGVCIFPVGFFIKVVDCSADIEIPAFVIRPLKTTDFSPATSVDDGETVGIPEGIPDDNTVINRRVVAPELSDLCLGQNLVFLLFLAPVLQKIHVFYRPALFLAELPDPASPEW